MNPGCPHLSCSSPHVISHGYYPRKDDSRRLKRFLCKGCGKSFSHSTLSLEYKQRKRRINLPFLKLYCSSLSLRRIALVLGVNIKTAERRFFYWSKRSQGELRALYEKLQHDPVTHLQLDDLITIEHTKLKPLSVTTMVDAKRRLILGTRVSIIPAFGHLAALSRKKYGKRISQHKQKLTELFEQMVPIVHPQALIEFDKHKLYPQVQRQFFPQAEVKRYEGEKGCVVGQGELKKISYDPLFKINHTLAMLRANINRLVRRTWCTTKKPENLQHHLNIFIYFYNQYLLKNPLEG